METTTVKLGQAVTYLSSKGHKKLGLVLSTPDTVTPDTGLPALTEGQAHLVVLSPTGNAYMRYNVPSKASVEGMQDFLNDDGEPVEVWEEV